MDRNRGFNRSPLDHVQEALQNAPNHVMAEFHKFSSAVQTSVRPLQHCLHNLAGQLEPLQRSVGSFVRQHQQSMQPLAPFASLSMPNNIPRARPVFDLSMAKDEVKARLQPIPVYTVANQQNEFVLVTGEESKQMGFFFLNREDAEALVAKIKQENPKIAKDTVVMRTTLDSVYEVFTMPRDQSGLQGIHFRFMPDMKQIENALQLFSDANVPVGNFMGVPVFQADGLTVTTERQQYVPLFLNKEDMDIAVEHAYQARNSTQIKQYQDTAAKYQEEYERVRSELEKAKDNREKVLLEQKAEKAQQKYNVALRKAEDVARAPLPKIEVGSLEEVIQRMTASEGEDLAAWSQVMFVTPGVLTQKLQGGAGKKGK